MPREDEDYLADMRSYAQAALGLTEGLTFAEFKESTLHKHAVFYAVATVGEAASKISSGIRQNAPAIPWADIIGMRIHLIHVYFAIDLDIVWKTIREDLPALIAQLESLLPEQRS